MEVAAAYPAEAATGEVAATGPVFSWVGDGAMRGIQPNKKHVPILLWAWMSATDRHRPGLWHALPYLGLPPGCVLQSLSSTDDRESHAAPVEVHGDVAAARRGVRIPSAGVGAGYYDADSVAGFEDVVVGEDLPVQSEQLARLQGVLAGK